MKRSLTEGSVWSSLIIFSLPMIAGNMLQQVYSLVDTLIVGRFLGAGALAAVGSSYTLMVFLTSIVIGLCMGSGAYFSMDFGANDREKLEEDIYLSFVFIASVTLALYLIIYPGMNIILKLLKTPQEIYGVAHEYIMIVFAGMVFVFIYNFFAFLLRATGDSMTPLVFLGASSAINIVLDLYFVIKLEMGVAGAAWATVVAQAVSGIGIMLVALKRMPEARTAFKKRPGSKARLAKIIRNDLATGV